MATGISYVAFQIFLLGTSLALLAGSVVGLYFRAHRLSDEALSSFSRQASESKPISSHATERRCSRRLPSHVTLELQDGSGQFAEGNGQLLDISLKGACFKSSVLLRRGQRIVARLHSSKEGLLQVTARVVWLRQQTQDALYGIEFRRIDTLL